MTPPHRVIWGLWHGFLQVFEEVGRVLFSPWIFVLALFGLSIVASQLFLR